MTFQLEPGDRFPEIGEDDLEAAKAKIRYQTIGRYEDLFRVVRAQITGAEDGERPLDPRYLEIGIRILKEESLLYRLLKPAAPVGEDDDPAHVFDPAEQVRAQLLELEARAREQS
jgi:hypothetical protein